MIPVSTAHSAFSESDKNKLKTVRHNQKYKTKSDPDAPAVNFADLVLYVISEAPIRNFHRWIILLEKHHTVSSMVRSGVSPCE